MNFQFDSMSAFWDMGGYGFFVWSSFILTFLCMAAIVAHSIYVSGKIKAGVQKEKARAERIMAARAARKEKQKVKANQAALGSSNTSAAAQADATPSSHKIEVNDEPKT